MENHYLLFSEIVEDLKPEEESWLIRMLCTMDDIQDTIPWDEYLETEGIDGCDVRTWPDVQWIADQLANKPDDWECWPGFSWAFEKNRSGKTGLWLYAQESGNVDNAALLIQAFLRKFRPDQYFSLTYAFTCSKPRIGEFGGGAIFVTADDIQWNNSHSFVDDCKRRWGQGQN